MMNIKYVYVARSGRGRISGIVPELAGREGLSKTVKSLVRIAGLEIAPGTRSFPNMKLRNPR
jgi:hypothetical protein